MKILDKMYVEHDAELIHQQIREVIDKYADNGKGMEGT